MAPVTALRIQKARYITKASGAKCCDGKWTAHHADGLPVSFSRLYGRAGRFRSDRFGAACDNFHTSQRSLDDRADIQWHGCRGTACRTVFPLVGDLMTSANITMRMITLSQTL